jgi:hypothetical protein
MILGTHPMGNLVGYENHLAVQAGGPTAIILRALGKDSAPGGALMTIGLVMYLGGPRGSSTCRVARALRSLTWTKCWAFSAALARWQTTRTILSETNHDIRGANL